MRNFSVLGLLLLQSVVVLLVFFCDSLDFVILLGKNRQSVFFQVLDFLFKDSLDVLAIGFVDFGFSEKLSDFTLLFFNSLMSELFFLFDKLVSLFVFIAHSIVFY